LSPNSFTRLPCRVAQDLSESEDWLFGIATAMEPEDGLIWVCRVGDDGAMAFTDYGVENLIDLIKMHRDDPALLSCGDDEE